jgi:hypothetical protein
VQERRDHHRPRGVARQLLEEVDAGVPALGEHEHAVPGLAQAADQRAQLGFVGEARGHRFAAFAVVRGRSAGGKADRPGLHRLEDQFAHRTGFIRGRNPFRGRRAHHIGADRGMAGEHRDVERAAHALEHVEVLRHALEVPSHAGAQHVERHAFDLRQVAHHQLAVALAARRDGEAAVADDRGGHAEAG